MSTTDKTDTKAKTRKGTKVKVNRAAGLADGETVSGYYQGADDVRTRYGMRKIHFFQQKDGTDVKRWGSSNLNVQLAEIPHGTWVEVARLSKGADGRVDYDVERFDDDRVQPKTRTQA